jgi:hypothetical protein
MAKEVLATKKRRRLLVNEPNVGQPSQSSNTLEPGLMASTGGADPAAATDSEQTEVRVFVQ